MGDDLRFNIKQFNKSKPAYIQCITDKKLVKTNGFLCNDFECIHVHIDSNLVFNF